MQREDAPLIRLSIRAPAEHSEVVLAELLELAPQGFEQVDGDGFVEFGLYGAPGELPDLPRGQAHLGGIPIEVAGREVGDDWADRWRQFHKPVQIGHIHVRAPWHEPRGAADAGEAAGSEAAGSEAAGREAAGSEAAGSEAAGREAAGGDDTGPVDIVIDPGQAFGTGAHATTRLCLELLQDVPAGTAAERDPAADRGPLADLGCGSGVLAIAAAKLGFGPITAVDNEQAAVEATLANARVNGVTLERVERYDLRAGPAPVEPVTVANLVRPLLLRVAELLPEQPQALIVSGLLEGEEDEVAAAFASLRERRRLRLQEWSALLLTPP